MNNVVVIEQLIPETLGALFAEASSLGCIRIWQRSDISDRPINSFEVTITFRTKRGSRVEAKATHSSIACAVADAINEARELGAGEQ